MARAYTNEAVRRLAAIMRDPGKDGPVSASVQAAQILLDRGWGKALQPVSGADGKAIEITIRKMFDGGDSKA